MGSRFYNVTVTGKGCQNWMKTQHPEAGNNTYCSNPDPNNKNRPWCYTHDPATPWEYCTVPKCGELLVGAKCCLFSLVLLKANSTKQANITHK